MINMPTSTAIYHQVQPTSVISVRAVSPQHISQKVTIQGHNPTPHFMSQQKVLLQQQSSPHSLSHPPATNQFQSQVMNANQQVQVPTTTNSQIIQQNQQSSYNYNIKDALQTDSSQYMNEPAKQTCYILNLKELLVQQAMENEFLKSKIAKYELNAHEVQGILEGTCQLSANLKFEIQARDNQINELKNVNSYLMAELEKSHLAINDYQKGHNELNQQINQFKKEISEVRGWHGLQKDEMLAFSQQMNLQQKQLEKQLEQMGNTLQVKEIQIGEQSVDLQMSRKQIVEMSIQLERLQGIELECAQAKRNVEQAKRNAVQLSLEIDRLQSLLQNNRLDRNSSDQNQKIGGSQIVPFQTPLEMSVKKYNIPAKSQSSFMSDNFYSKQQREPSYDLMHSNKDHLQTSVGVAYTEIERLHSIIQARDQQLQNIINEKSALQAQLLQFQQQLQ